MEELLVSAVEPIIQTEDKGKEGHARQLPEK